MTSHEKIKFLLSWLKDEDSDFLILEEKRKYNRYDYVKCRVDITSIAKLDVLCKYLRGVGFSVWNWCDAGYNIFEIILQSCDDLRAK